MPDPKPLYANFPERELKVVLGPYISASNIKLLRKLTIGSYEMGVPQQEKIQGSAENARLALAGLARERHLTVATVETRDHAACHQATGEQQEFVIWVCTPFASGQTTHLIWCKFADRSQPRRIGVSFKMATSFSIEDFLALAKKAEEAAADLDPDQPYELKGNPPPRFQKKAKPTADGETEAKATTEAGTAPEAGSAPTA